MAFSLSPAVTIAEIDLSGIVPAVATSQAAIGGVFNWGPVEYRVLVTDETELVEFFGLPNDNNFETWFSAANFLSYGNQLYVSRAAANAFNSVSGPSINATSNTTSTVFVKNPNDFIAQFSTLDTGNYYYIARYAGFIGNSLRVSVCDSPHAYTSNVSGNTADLATFAFTIGSNVCVLTVTDGGGNTVLANTMANTIIANLAIFDYIQAGNTLIGYQYDKILSLGNVSTVSAGVVTANIGLQDIFTLSSNVSQNSVTRYWEFYSVVQNTPNTTPYCAARGGSGDEMHIIIVDELGLFTGTKREVLEVWGNVSRATDAIGEQGGSIYYKNVINTDSSYVWWLADRGGTNSGLANTMTTLTTLPFDVFLYGGQDSLTESAIDNASLARSYDQFVSSEDVDISLVICGKAVGGIQGTQNANYIINNICQVRLDCVAFVSPNFTAVVNQPLAPEQQVVNFRNQLNSTSYAVLDSGYGYQFDKYNDIYRWIPLNGHIAGLCARTDYTNDPWWSPAGFNRGQLKNIIQLAFNPNKARRDILYINGVNPVVTFPGEGTILFGDKTLQAKPSAFDRINVRRLFIVLEKAIAIAAKFMLFEFNDAFTRAQFVNMVEPYLRDVEGRRGIYDFLVVCDETNNTPDIIDANEFVGDIYVKPARSINFIQLNFVAVRTGVAFSEVVGQF